MYQQRKEIKRDEIDIIYRGSAPRPRNFFLLSFSLLQSFEKLSRSLFRGIFRILSQLSHRDANSLTLSHFPTESSPTQHTDPSECANVIFQSFHRLKARARCTHNHRFLGLVLRCSLLTDEREKSEMTSLSRGEKGKNFSAAWQIHEQRALLHFLSSHPPLLLFTFHMKIWLYEWMRRRRLRMKILKFFLSPIFFLSLLASSHSFAVMIPAP